MLQGSLHRGPVLHLLGEATIPGAGRVLLLHGGPDATHGRLLVLQHVCEALIQGHLGGAFQHDFLRRRGTHVSSGWKGCLLYFLSMTP